MITTKQLALWRKDIATALETALNLTSRFSATNKDMCAYYAHLAQTADAQLALIQRLSMQSVENDKTSTASSKITGEAK